MNIYVPAPPVRGGGRQANNGEQRFQGGVKGMHGNGTLETIQEVYQTLKMDRDVSRKCHYSLARHDERHNIHPNLKISNSYSYTSDYNPTAVNSTSDRNRTRSSAACENTKEEKFNTARAVGIRVTTSVGRWGRGRSEEKQG